jgi:hypothetical protein
MTTNHFWEENMADANSTELVGRGAQYDIQWAWGQNLDLAFDPAKNTLNFGWFTVHQPVGTWVV